jgi:thiazole synthase
VHQFSFVQRAADLLQSCAACDIRNHAHSRSPVISPEVTRLFKPIHRPALLLLAVLASHAPAHAVLNVGDNGPVIDAGGFRMRVTNAGIVGNAFLDAGRSFDPSFEFPPHSSIEMLNYAALWVGAVDDRGRTRVSGGPLLEFRPTLDPEDDVRFARRGDPGTRWRFDDDGDGRVDEEILNGRDDDGDGAIDEDLGFTFDQLMAADFVDDRPEAVNFTYEGGETHIPLGLSVHQEVGAWSRVGFNRAAVLRYSITNHGTAPLRDVYVGLLVDLDAKQRDDRTGHLDDVIVQQSYSRTFNEGIGLNIITINGSIPRPGPGAVPPPAACITSRSYSGPVLIDGFSTTTNRITIIPLDHTTDPIARIGPIASYARAPATPSFRTSIYSAKGVSGQGGVPRLDADRYNALAGRLQTSVRDKDDHVVLVACGPFRVLDPGQSLTFEAALVVGESADSLQTSVENLLYLHQGYWANLRPDYMGRDSTEYTIGATGRNAHEVEIVSPPGVTFTYDANCVSKFPEDSRPEFPPLTTYLPGVPVWTDADCNACTGFRGMETRIRWIDPGQVPPAPRVRLIPRDHEVTIAWDNSPEALLAAGAEGFQVLAYTSEDVITALRLEDAGCAAVMPLASPIGSGLGLVNPYFIREIKSRLSCPVIVDAGVGTASDAALTMEQGVDGILMNTALAEARDPVRMSHAMRLAVQAGRLAFLAGRMPRREVAVPSSPATGMID